MGDEMAHWLPIMIGANVAIVPAVGWAAGVDRIVLALGGFFCARSRRPDAKGDLGDFIDHGAQGG